MSDKQERYVIHESSLFLGSYSVLDQETMEEVPFYNLASARSYLKNIEEKQDKDE
jgi:hypothetical protein